MSTSRARMLEELDELTTTRQAGREASERARQVVRQALRAGIPVAELIGRPFSRAEVNNIKREMRDRGELE